VPEATAAVVEFSAVAGVFPAAPAIEGAFPVTAVPPEARFSHVQAGAPVPVVDTVAVLNAAGWPTVCGAAEPDETSTSGWE
jgi:hypothetical protein